MYVSFNIIYFFGALLNLLNPFELMLSVGTVHNNKRYAFAKAARQR